MTTTDGGMFETNLREERFLPFEGAGAISTWTLALPTQLRAFDTVTKVTGFCGSLNVGDRAYFKGIYHVSSPVGLTINSNNKS